MFWHSKSEDWSTEYAENPHEEGFTPVVLLVEVPDPSKLIPDEIGTQDAFAEAWIYTDSIPAENIYIWDSGEEESGWFEISSIIDEPLDTSLAYDVEIEIDENTGESIESYYLKDRRNSPLYPKFEED
jgi:hypothetical protein